MNIKIFDLALWLGSACIYGSLALHLLAGIIPFRSDIRSELQDGAKETSLSGLLFLIFGWVFGPYLRDQLLSAEKMLAFGKYYILAYLVLLVGGLLLRMLHWDNDPGFHKRIRRSALRYGILFFVLGTLLG